MKSLISFDILTKKPFVKIKLNSAMILGAIRRYVRYYADRFSVEERKAIRSKLPRWLLRILDANAR